MKSVLVLGGTGFIGRHVCEKLQREGWAITVPTRRALNAASIQHLPRVTVIETDVHDSGHLLDVLSGHDAVVNLVAILHGSEDDFERVHVELPLSIVEACAADGVRRVVHISALGADPNAPSRYLRSKARGEEVLRGAGLDLTILRPSVVFGAGDRFLNLFARLQESFPIVPLASAQARFQPVWVEDVATAVARSLRDHTLPQRSVGQTIECTGPDVFTLAELVRIAGRYGSRERPVWPLPGFLARLQAGAMELAPGEPLISRDNLDSMSVDNVATHQYPGLSALAITPSSVLSVAPTYLGQRGGRSTLLAYRHSAGR